MDDLLLATSIDDARAAEDLAGDHTAMRGTLHVLTDQLVRAVAGADAALAGAARERLVTWCGTRLLPHLEAEETHLLPAVRVVTDGGPATAIVVRLHAAVRAAVDDVARTTDPLVAVGAARSVVALMDVHADTLDADLVPLVARDGATALTPLAAEVREALLRPVESSGGGCGCGGGDCGGGGGRAEAPVTEAVPAQASEPAPDDHGCGCGGHDEPAVEPEPVAAETGCGCGSGGCGGDARADAPAGAPAADAAADAAAPTDLDVTSYPELDATVVPHAVRHATIFGGLDAVEPGSGMVLVAPHDPLPLLAQIEQRWPGRFRVEYLTRGPVTWRLAFVR